MESECESVLVGGAHMFRRQVAPVWVGPPPPTHSARDVPPPATHSNTVSIESAARAFCHCCWCLAL
jgi:hypothetical protein